MGKLLIEVEIPEGETCEGCLFAMFDSCVWLYNQGKRYTEIDIMWTHLEKCQRDGTYRAGMGPIQMKNPDCPAKRPT